MLSKQIKVFAWTCFLSTMPVLLLGCAPQEKIGTVTGRVTIKGKPMTTGRIEFSNQQTGIATNANLKEDGTFVVQTYDAKGLPPGEYKVAIHGISFRPGDELRVDMGNHRQKAALVPKKYQNSATSELTATVREGENEPFHFEL